MLKMFEKEIEDFKTRGKKYEMHNLIPLIK